MNKNAISNPCIRCGKQRIVTSVKKENIGGSIVTVTMMSCPDLECQAIVDKGLKADKEKRERIKNESVQREEQRRKNISKRTQLRLGPKKKIWKN